MLYKAPGSSRALVTPMGWVCAVHDRGVVNLLEQAEYGSLRVFDHIVHDLFLDWL